jgi:hypothetical protein
VLRHNSGQAFFRVKGTNIYLGKHGTPESREKYERLIGEYLASGRHEPAKPASAGSLTVEQLGAAYLRHCESYYTESEFKGIRSMTRRLNSVFGSMAAADMSPRKVKQLREATAAEVHVLELPNSKDFSDWKAAGGTKTQFVDLAGRSLAWHEARAKYKPQQADPTCTD